MEVVKFRFESMDIWKEAIILSESLFIICDNLRSRKYYSLADQLFRATLSISNNIAEGSGSVYDKEFSNFLNISRRSVFEVVNILQITYQQNLIAEEEVYTLKARLHSLSKMIFYFRKKLLDN